MVLFCVLALFDDSSLLRWERGPQPQEEARPRTEPLPETGRAAIDWERLELNPRLGFVFYSEAYDADPEFALALHARAPMPWMSPSADPRGDYFGLYASLTLTSIDRDEEPGVEDGSGTVLLLSLGVDYTLVRNETWLVLAHAGLQYATYGGADGLNDGFGFVIGATGGLRLGSALSLTYTPELVFGHGSSLLYLHTVGLSFEF